MLIDEDGKYLFDTYYISYLNVSRDIIRFNKPANILLSDPLILGDPDFDLSRYGALPRLGES